MLAWQDRVHRVLAPRGEHGRMRVRVWDSEVDAARADPATCAWIRRCLGAELELVHMDAEARRWVDPARAGPGRPLSFADADPWLLVSASPRCSTSTGTSVLPCRSRPSGPIW
ncbi:MAG: hypothetical protein KatS3mg126_0666 [Lysobacteraceae bacterium]|nr:MAG: hypothetical protein KatS3mg126_0666 [Xanthomonadaceae bacterium]